MNEYVEKAKKVLFKTTGKVVEKSTNIYSTAKVSVKISSAKSKIEGCYTQLGEIMYNNYKGADVSSEAVEKICDTIDSLKAEINKLSEEMATLKGLEVCPECGAQIKDGSAFCAKCGKEI